MRVVAAMSGGVDSAVAVARMVDAGHDVVGVHLALNRSAATLRLSARGCCTLEDAADARRVADVLGIPFYVWDLSEAFHREVVDDFVAEYAQGRTPNPCIRCNEKVKFAALLDRALALGFDAVATGHYARIERSRAGERELHRARDLTKDQSYVLGVLDPAQLAATELPLGPSLKDDVRSEAAARGLAVARKPDSHDICFIPDGDTRGFLARHVAMTPGLVVDEVGAPVGSHDGAVGFTVGQRHGLRLDRPAPDGRPRYVLDISPVDATVVVGPRESLAVDAVIGTSARWCGPAPTTTRRLGAQIRAHGAEIPAVVSVAGEQVEVAFEAPVAGVARGQTVVLYDGTRVVGSATIDTTRRRATAAR
jgi:tRNA-specific 2-thiouridylase